MAWHSLSLRQASPLLLSALLMAGGAACAAGPPSTPDAAQILLDSLQPRAVVYVGDQVTELVGSGRPPGRQRVYRSATRLRIEFPGGQVVLDDGTSQFRYFPGMGIVERGPSDLDSRRSRFVRRVLTTGRAAVERQPDDTVASRPAYVVLLRDARGRRPPRRIWIDKENATQLRQDVEQEGGRVQSTRFTTIRFGQEPPIAKMLPTWPANTPVVPRVPGRLVRRSVAFETARAWGGLLTPRFLPPGFRLRGFYQQGHSARPRIVAYYDDFATRRILSISQSLAPPPVSAPVSPPGGSSSTPPRKRNGREEEAGVSEVRGVAKVTVAGSLPEAQLRQVLDSVQ